MITEFKDMGTKNQNLPSLKKNYQNLPILEGQKNNFTFFMDKTKEKFTRNFFF